MEFFKIIDAIKRINNDAVFNIGGTDIDSCEITWLNGTESISKDDIKNMITTMDNEKETEDANKETNKTSGKQKLKDLGLDDAEIKALMGV